MKLHQSLTEFNCGIDLHTTSMYVCIMNRAGKILVHQKVAANDLNYFLRLLAPYRHDVTVTCESTINWYFLYDFCHYHEINFVLGHALYMRAISQAKVKNDKVDSQRIADLLRTNLLPEAYTCPRELRDARDLLRKRLRLVQKRTELKTSLTTSTYMYGYMPPTTAEKASKSRRRAAYLERADSTFIAEGYEAYHDIIDCLDVKIHNFEKLILEHTKMILPEKMVALISAPGLGRISGLTILYESGDVNRFAGVKQYCSYSRVACNESMSNGKSYGSRGRKMGNKYLKWAFDQVTVHAATADKSIRRYRDHLRSKHGNTKARNIIAHRFAKFAYLAITKERHFDVNEFLKGKESMIVKD